MNLSDAIAQLQIVNDQQTANSLGISPRQPTAEQVGFFRGFQSHCVQKGCLPVPKPALVADWLNTLDTEHLEAACRSVEVVCDHQFLSNPCATLAVRIVLERRLRTECPRSWTKDDRLVFATLPPEIRSIVLRRENERDTALRRAQNQLAAKRKPATTEKAENNEQ